VNLRRCLLGAQKKVVTRRSRASLWLAFSAVVLVIAALAALRIRENLRWAHYLDRLRSQPGIVVVDSRRNWFGYAVNGLRDPLAIDPVPLLAEFRVPKSKVVERWEPYLSLDPAFALARRLETEKALVERQVIRFDLNSAQLPLSQFDTLDAAAEGISALRKSALANHQRIAIRIEGHTDQTGKEDRNMELSAERAQMVAKLLLRRGVTAEMLNAEGLGGSHPEHAGDETYPAELDRRVTFQVFLLPLQQDPAGKGPAQ
jgi:OOP family OmpA-OmpF porin